MRKSKIQTRVEEIRKTMASLEIELKGLQTLCKHKTVEKEQKVHVSPYYRSDDKYWTEYTCAECGKWWKVDGTV